MLAADLKQLRAFLMVVGPVLALARLVQLLEDLRQPTPGRAMQCSAAVAHCEYVKSCYRTLSVDGTALRH
jgi:hypothetical protein